MFSTSKKSEINKSDNISQSTKQSTTKTYQQGYEEIKWLTGC